jgi:hypothetical protein
MRRQISQLIEKEHFFSQATALARFVLIHRRREGGPMQLAHNRASVVSGAQEVSEVTLLELVQAVSEVTDDDREVVATVRHLIRSGRVRLCGNFRGYGPGAFDG